MKPLHDSHTPATTSMTDSIPLGRYRHYKGKEYTVLGVAKHSETQELLVVYRPEYGERGWWVRPLSMFCENVMVDGRSVPRFERIVTGAEPIDLEGPDSDSAG
jgi:hypothetical protein